MAACDAAAFEIAPDAGRPAEALALHLHRGDHAAWYALRLPMS